MSCRSMTCRTAARNRSDCLEVRKAHLHTQQIRVPLLRQQVVKQHPILQRREGVDVLDVRNPTGHLRNDAIDVILLAARSAGASPG